MPNRFPLHLAAATVTAALATGVALPAAAGVHYEAVTTTAPAQGKPATISVEAWVEGPGARVEFREGDNPIFRGGTYMVTRDAGETLYMVDPEEKTYAVWDVEQMIASLGGMLQSMGALIKIEFSNPKVEALATEAGPEIHGLPTTHYRYRTTYTMRMRVLGMNQESATERVQDIWSTEDLSDLQGMGVWLRNRPSFGDPALDKLVAAEMAKTKGFPLKSVDVTTSTDKKGRVSTARTTMEVTRFERGVAVAADRFEVPAGYQRIEAVPGTIPAGGPDAGEGGNPWKSILGGG